MTDPDTTTPPPAMSCHDLLANVMNSAREVFKVDDRITASIDADAWNEALAHVIATAGARP